ncbi:MAG: putative tellurite resistance protein B-like protein [Gammaproteobacteria bacterium]|jgi:uncharacterized tellurite resistance protein B-like protein
MKFLIDKLFGDKLISQSPEKQEHRLQVATATLLLEVVRADFETDEREVKRMRQLLIKFFDLSDDELNDLIAGAEEEANQLVSIQHLTRLLNEQYAEPDKIRIIEMMWQLVFADGNLDHYEEHLIRQVAELLYLPHSAFIQARHKAEPPVM